MQNIHQEIIKYIIRLKPKTAQDLMAAKRKSSKRFKVGTTSNINLLLALRQLVNDKKLKPSPVLERLLVTREIRTLSGVAVIAVLTKPYPCTGKCVYCPSEKDMPKSYLSNEPAVIRAILNKFDPYKQVRMRLNALTIEGHKTDKIELIVMGGTWSCLNVQYQKNYIKRCLDSLNGTVSKTIEEAQKRNEKAKHRCVGLTLETRPDYINEKEIKRMREYGCTRVELGVQSIDDSVLKLCKRGHGVDKVVEATKLLKNTGFKITYHMMPALPGSTPKKDEKMFAQLFFDHSFQPDMLKIYPCAVTKDSVIYRWHKKGKFKPYSDKKLFATLLSIKKNIPTYVRIIRLIRDIPKTSIIAGTDISNLRQDLQRELKASNKRCRCIRCREIKNLEFKKSDIKLKKVKYRASGGIEYFLSYEDVKQDKILAFLRLRLPLCHSRGSGNPCSIIPKKLNNRERNSKIININNTSNNLYKIFPELEDAALIREVHTYGQMAQIGKIGKTQHYGFGKKLMSEAEKIAIKNGFTKIAVISGIGVRGYYKTLGYRLSGTYMVKKI